MDLSKDDMRTMVNAAMVRIGEFMRTFSEQPVDRTGEAGRGGLGYTFDECGNFLVHFRRIESTSN